MRAAHECLPLPRLRVRPAAPRLPYRRRADEETLSQVFGGDRGGAGRTFWSSSNNSIGNATVELPSLKPECRRLVR